MKLQSGQWSCLLLSIFVFSTPAQATIFSQNTPAKFELKFTGKPSYLAEISNERRAEFRKLLTERQTELDLLTNEIKAVRVNFRISNAEKRKILPQFRPRIQSTYSRYNDRILSFLETAAERKFYNDMVEYDKKNMYKLLDCPDNGGTMCI
jgi:hypothetical protein